jgi:hypothetical protein
MLKKFLKKTKLTTTIPPKSGPLPQGLNIKYNNDTSDKLEKINGRNRQVSTERRANNKRSST